jgi:hypothetical protein
MSDIGGQMAEVSVPLSSVICHLVTTTVVPELTRR